MFRLLFGALLGAAAMYFLDPREGRTRRRKVTDRVREFQHRGNGAGSFSDMAYDTSHTSAHRADEEIHEAMQERSRSSSAQRRTGSGLSESVVDESPPL